jgi:hypothetical protein
LRPPSGLMNQAPTEINISPHPSFLKGGLSRRFSIGEVGATFPPDPEGPQDENPNGQVAKIQEKTRRPLQPPKMLFFVGAQLIAPAFGLRINENPPLRVVDTTGRRPHPSFLKGGLGGLINYRLQICRAGRPASELCEGYSFAFCSLPSAPCPLRDVVLRDGVYALQSNGLRPLP